MKNIIFVAAPAAGKGTQSDLLIKKYDYMHISTGDLLRNEVKSGSKLGCEINEIISKGNLVSSSIVSELLTKALANTDKPFILDGYPRNLEQVSILNDILKSINKEIGAVIYLNVPKDILLERVVGRLYCPTCGRTYHRTFNKPLNEGICDDCHSTLLHRDDDTEEIFTTRLNTYLDSTYPVLNYYRDNVMVTIKSKEEIEIMRKAGHLNYLTHKYVSSLIVPGITTKYLNDEAEKFILKNGGKPGFLNYEGYPGAICVSVNDEVVHGIGSNRVLLEGDIVTLDIGVVIDGYHSDSAWTYPVGKVSYAKERLMRITENCLWIGLKEVKNGAHLNNIGAKISEYAHKNKVGVIKELVGHGVGRDLHEDPDVPNYGKYNTGLILKTGMCIAVEPMITAGNRHICVLDDDWTIVTEDGKDSAHFEHTVVVTDDGYEILTGE